jgi:hypothetical protein
MTIKMAWKPLFVLQSARSDFQRCRVRANSKGAFLFSVCRIDFEKT